MYRDLSPSQLLRWDGRRSVSFQGLVFTYQRRHLGYLAGAIQIGEYFIVTHSLDDWNKVRIILSDNNLEVLCLCFFHLLRIQEIFFCTRGTTTSRSSPSSCPHLHLLPSFISPTPSSLLRLLFSFSGSGLLFPLPPFLSLELFPTLFFSPSCTRFSLPPSHHPFLPLLCLSCPPFFLPELDTYPP